MDKQLQLMEETEAPARTAGTLLKIDGQPSTQLQIGQTREQAMQQRLESLKCSACGRLEPREFDICTGEDNASVCADCIRARHAAHGLRGKGFEVDGEWVLFYSQTTGMERFKTEDIHRVFPGCFSNTVFPYCINVMGPMHYPNDRTEWGSHCFGITKEFGDWLINNFTFTKTALFEEENGEAWERTVRNPSVTPLLASEPRREAGRNT